MDLKIKHLLFVTMIMLFTTGCVTDGSSFLGPTKQQQQQKQLEQRKQQIATINRDNRITELETSIAILRSEFDSINGVIASQNQRIAELENRLANEQRDHENDIKGLNSELAVIRNSQSQLSTKVDGIPQNFTKLLSQQEKQIMTQVDQKVAAVKSSKGRGSSTASVNYDGPCYEHEVEAGQTLSEIAQAYKVSQKEIMEVNNIKDASRIRVGQKLYIPKH